MDVWVVMQCCPSFGVLNEGLTPLGDFENERDLSPFGGSFEPFLGAIQPGAARKTNGFFVRLWVCKISRSRFLYLMDFFQC